MRFSSIEEMIVASAASVRPPERLTVSQAATRYRRLNNPGSYVGPWLNEKTPYLVEPMDEMTSLNFTGVIYAGPARTGKSDMFFNYLGHTVNCDPADMMVVHMTQNTARDWSQGDLRKVFRHSPEIGKHVTPGKQNLNVHDIKFLSGMRLLVKWPTITELSGKTIPRLWLMDYDRMTQDVDGEGNPYDLTLKRATTFKRFGMCVAESSPGFEVEDPKWMPETANSNEAPPTKGILALYNRGDRRRWNWRCPQCREAFEGDFKHLSYPKSNDPMEAAEAAVLVCPHDGFPMEHDQFKQELNAGGRWIKEGQLWLPDGSIAGTARRSDKASFWQKGVSAAFQDWKSLVFKYLTAEAEFERTGDEAALKTTTNVDQGHAYVPKAVMSERLPETLKERAQDWGGSAEEPVVPPGVRFLVATVDIQAGTLPTFVVQVQGIGVGSDYWYIDMFKIRKSHRLDADGHPAPVDPAAYLEDWFLLIEQVIERSYPLADGSGRRMAVKMVGCDSGGAAGVTFNAYNFWRYLRDGPQNDEEPAPGWRSGLHKRFRLVKGDPKPASPRIREGFPDAQRKDRHSGARGDVPVLFINTNLMKDQVVAMMGRTEPGGGMLNYPYWAPGWFYSQLTNEVRTAKGWENPSKKRNEALDLTVYALSICLHHEIRLEHLDWSSPPGWAAEWDTNDLVLAPGITKQFENHPKVEYDLEALAQDLA